MFGISVSTEMAAHKGLEQCRTPRDAHRTTDARVEASVGFSRMRASREVRAIAATPEGPCAGVSQS